MIILDTYRKPSLLVRGTVSIGLFPSLVGGDEVALNGFVGTNIGIFPPLSTWFEASVAAAGLMNAYQIK